MLRNSHIWEEIVEKVLFIKVFVAFSHKKVVEY